MATARVAPAAARLANGKVLVAGGGHDGSTSLASAELYDPSAGTFTATGSMNVARHNTTGTLLATGKILVAGGYSMITSSQVQSAELYDPTTGTFAAAGTMTSARDQHTAIALSDRRVLLVGGGGTSAELYYY